MDIQTIADLLNEFVKAEAEILNNQDIKHPTTIGTMYEGLTAEILNKSMFQGLNLKVVKNSLIVGCNAEFDVLLVEGEGENIPYTDRFKYNPEQVIAVIQVKKNLYSKDIEEGYNNLKFLIDYFESIKPEIYMRSLFRDSFRHICRKDITTQKFNELSEIEELIFHTLKTEALLPVRIIWGYNGFSSEYNFRESFYDYLSKNVTTDFSNKIGGFGPHNFPNLIICGDYSMFKNNAMPFIVPVQEDGWWPFYASSSYNPTYFFLELIWTRLTYKFECIPSEIFGDDLSMEPANRFLDCRVKKIGDQQGWEYNNILISDKNLKANTEVVEWQPSVLDQIQYIVINELCRNGEIDLNSNVNFETFITESGIYNSLVDFIITLQTTGLVFVENNKLKLLTDKCQCAIMPNGKYVAGENKSGRFTNWIMKEINRQKEE